MPSPAPEPDAAGIERLIAAGNHAEAIAAAERFAQAAPAEAARHLLLARACRPAGQHREAMAAVERALKLAPKDAEAALFRALMLRDRGNREEAEAAVREVLAAGDDSAQAHYQLAVLLQERGTLDEAAEAFRRTTERAPDHQMAWSLMGVSLRDAGRQDEAVAALRRAVELAPADLPARNALVTALVLAGDEAAAREQGEICLEQKDRRAIERFRTAPWKDAALSERDMPPAPRERARNIISFSLWGDDPVYTHGAVINARIAPHLYYGWRCRFYVERETVPENVLKAIRDEGSEVVYVDDPALKKLKPLWRFFAANDPGIDRFMCRDADSRLNSMEAVAVDDWVQSGRRFHVMRDHLYHMEVMLAGMWGGVAGVLPDLAAIATRAGGFTSNRWSDQEFLRDVVWPLIKPDVLVHDSYYTLAPHQDFPPYCRLPRPIHVGGAVKQMKPFEG